MPGRAAGVAAGAGAETAQRRAPGLGGTGLAVTSPRGATGAGAAATTGAGRAAAGATTGRSSRRRIIPRAISGFSAMTSARPLRERRKSRAFSVTVAVQTRGLPSSRKSSPKKSPGPSTSLLPEPASCTWPDSIRYISVPVSPSRNTGLPAPISTNGSLLLITRLPDATLPQFSIMPRHLRGKQLRLPLVRPTSLPGGNRPARPIDPYMNVPQCNMAVHESAFRLRLQTSDCYNSRA